MRPEDLLARLEAGYEYDPMYGRLCNERDQLKAENAKLREACAELLNMAESSDPEWLHWPEMHDELRKLGVKIVEL